MHSLRSNTYTTYSMPAASVTEAIRQYAENDINAPPKFGKDAGKKGEFVIPYTAKIVIQHGSAEITWAVNEAVVQK